MCVNSVLPVSMLRILGCAILRRLLFNFHPYTKFSLFTEAQRCLETSDESFYNRRAVIAKPATFI